MKSQNIYTLVESCKSCGSKQLQILHDFGAVPLAGYFPIEGEENEINRIPMTLLHCSQCSLIQISQLVDDSYLFSDYRYRSFFSMKKHFNELASWIESLGFSKNSKILEIGSNDGTLLSELKAIGFEPTGIDPAQNITKYSIALGHNVINGFFSEELVREKDLKAKTDLVISCNSFAHISNIKDVARAANLSLVEGGYFLIEVQSWEELVKKRAFDFVYHEHKFYYSERSMKNLLEPLGFKMVSVTNIDSHGGSYRFLFKKIDREETNYNYKMDESQNMNNDFHLSFKKFCAQIDLLNLRLQEIRKDGGKVIGFGASGRANMLLDFMKVPNLIGTLYDESPERTGRNMGFTKIRIEKFSE